MAEDVLILNNVLCFLLSRYNRCNVRSLKSALCDFYNVEDICGAKESLASAANGLSTSVNLPKLTRRRDGEGRLARELDDMFAILATIDEAKQLNKLPTFVSDSPDKMPSIHLVEGDMTAVMRRLDKVEAMLDTLGMSVNKSVALTAAMIDRGGVNHTTGTVSEKPAELESETRPSRLNARQSLPARASANARNPLDRVRRADNAASTDSGSGMETDADDYAVGDGRKRRRMLSRPDVAGSNSVSPRPNTSSQPVHARSRRGPDNTLPLQSRGGETHSVQNQNRNSTTPFGSASFAVITGRAPAADPGARGSRRVKDKPLIGRNVSTSPTGKITAAKPYVGKSVFCVDNVSTSVTTSELCVFVARHGISVISCFETIPRRSHKQKQQGFIPNDRRPFDYVLHERIAINC